MAQPSQTGIQAGDRREGLRSDDAVDRKTAVRLDLHDRRSRLRSKEAIRDDINAVVGVIERLLE
jgi:hypothetical protein